MLARRDAIRPTRSISLIPAALVMVGALAVPAHASPSRAREFPVPTPFSSPVGIAAGPDGNLWFTELGANQIGRITTGGSVTEFAVPTPSSAPHDIAAGPDGNLWFTEYNGYKLVRITTGGAITEFGSPPTGGSGPFGSLKIDAAYHHLYEHGNCPLFVAIGQITQVPAVIDGQVVARPQITLRYTFDERVEDGLYCASSLQLVKQWIEDPASWLASLVA